MEFIILLIVVLGFCGAGALRKSNKDKKMRTIPANVKENSLLFSIVELVAFAGGIYLVLILLIQLLTLIGVNVTFQDLSFDPVAAVAKVLALLQPCYERLRCGKPSN